MNAGPRVRSGTSGTIKGSARETRGLLLQKLPLDEIARTRGLVSRTIVGHVVRLIESGDVSPAEYLVPTGDRLDRISEAFRVHGYYELRPVHEALDYDYSYDELQIARAYLRSSHQDTLQRVESRQIWIGTAPPYFIRPQNIRRVHKTQPRFVRTAVAAQIGVSVHCVRRVTQARGEKWRTACGCEIEEQAA